jgi:prepilin-type N-terminal cleavage/methylation domain-containing protein
MCSKAEHRSGGFTLIEMLIVVAIIGILAAVAIPVFSGYVLRSKSSEVFNILQGIKEKEEAYFSEFKYYSGDIAYTPYACDGVARTSTFPWAIAANSEWAKIGFDPGGPTYYTYKVDTPYSDAGVFSGDAFPTGFEVDPAPGSPTPLVVRPWYVVAACGDLDQNGKVALFFVTSINREVIQYNLTDSKVDDSVY